MQLNGCTQMDVLTPRMASLPILPQCVATSCNMESLLCSAGCTLFWADYALWLLNSLLLYAILLLQSAHVVHSFVRLKGGLEDVMGCILPCRGHEVALGDNQKVTRQKKRRYNEINHVTSVSCSLLEFWS